MEVSTTPLGQRWLSRPFAVLARQPMSRMDRAVIMRTGPKTGVRQNETFAPAIALPQGD